MALAATTNGNGAKGKDLIGGPSGHRIELVVGSLPDTCTLSAAVVSSRLLLGQQCRSGEELVS